MVKHKKVSKKSIIIILAVVILLSGAAGVVLQNKRHNDAEKAAKAAAAEAAKKTYAGPTEQEIRDSNAHKDEVVNQMKIEENAANNPSTTKKSVTPIITSASQSGQSILVTAYISGVFEDGGSCVLTATKGQDKVTKTHSASKNATTTDCAPFSLTRTDFSSAGDWSVIISYNSSTAEGSSQARTLKVQ